MCVGYGRVVWGLWNRPPTLKRVPSRKRHRLAPFVIAALAGSLVVAGCAKSAPPGLHSQSPSAPTTHVSAVATLTGPVTIGSAQLTRDDPTLAVHISWPTVQGATAFNDLVSQYAHSLEDQFLKTHTASKTNPPELNATGSLILLAHGIVGVRMRVSELGSGVGPTMCRTFYGNLANDTAWTGADLIDGSHRQQALALISSSAQSQGQTPLNPISPSAGDAILAGLAFDTHGDLLASPDPGSLFPAGDELIRVTVPAATATPLLSANGRLTQSAQRDTPRHAASSSTTLPPVTPTAPQTPVNCQVVKCVALTFDDGPGPYTEKLLDELDKAGVKATFFEIGEHAKIYPDVVARQVEDGMVVGNHTWDHPQLNHLSLAGQQREVQLADRWITAGGAPIPTLLRPPYGSYNHATRTLGKSLILWDVDSEDWKNLNSDKTTALIMKEIHPGAIVLMHDIHPTTVAAVPGIIKQLEQDGYHLVTVPELLGTPQPGSVHFGQHH